MNRQQSVIAVAGATGNLGQNIVEVLTTTFKPFFSRVVALSRTSSSLAAIKLTELGAEVHQLPKDLSLESLVEALKGVDVFVNALDSVDLKIKNMFAQAAFEAGVVVYFPSEYGIDHRLNEFPGFDHSAWETKRAHAEFVEGLAKEASQAGREVTIISVYTGLFLEDVLTVYGPSLGIALQANHVATLSPTSRTTFTSKHDIALSIAQLAVLSMKPSPPSELVNTQHVHIRIAGYTASASELAHDVDKARKALRVLEDNTLASDPPQQIEVNASDLQAAKHALKERVQAGDEGYPVGHLWILMGEGKLDFSDSNSNALINPEGKLWQWRTAADVVLEHKV